MSLGLVIKKEQGCGPSILSHRLNMTSCCSQTQSQLVYRTICKDVMTLTVMQPYPCSLNITNISLLHSWESNMKTMQRRNQHQIHHKHCGTASQRQSRITLTCQKFWWQWRATPLWGIRSCANLPSTSRISGLASCMTGCSNDYARWFLLPTWEIWSWIKWIHWIISSNLKKWLWMSYQKKPPRMKMKAWMRTNQRPWTRTTQQWATKSLFLIQHGIENPIYCVMSQVMPSTTGQNVDDRTKGCGRSRDRWGVCLIDALLLESVWTVKTTQSMMTMMRTWRTVRFWIMSKSKDDEECCEKDNSSKCNGKETMVYV